jgi:hypothetical protein
MVRRIWGEGVVRRILELVSGVDLDIFLVGLVREAMRGYAPRLVRGEEKEMGKGERERERERERDTGLRG